MRPFTVIWTPAAENQLTELWLAADDRAATTTAADAIDKQLRTTDPESQGVELSEELRAITHEPLRVYYSVHVDDRLVKVVWVSLTTS